MTEQDWHTYLVNMNLNFIQSVTAVNARKYVECSWNVEWHARIYVLRVASPCLAFCYPVSRSRQKDLVDCLCTRRKYLKNIQLLTNEGLICTCFQIVSHITMTTQFAFEIFVDQALSLIVNGIDIILHTSGVRRRFGKNIDNLVIRLTFSN